MEVIVWLLIALVAGIIEASTVSLVSVWFAIGGVAGAIGAGFGVSVGVQIGIFIVVSAILMVATAPLCKKFRIAAKNPTNADRLIGCIGIVTEEIDPLNNKGEVKVKGQAWSAQALGEELVPVGSKVVVEEIAGVHLVVKVQEEKEREE